MISCKQIRQFIIKPALDIIGLYSVDAEELLVATMAHESKGGMYLHQVGGPALGLFQMEPSTHDDLWNRATVKNFLSNKKTSDHMMWDLQYAVIMARLFYFCTPNAMPPSHDTEAIWKIYKQKWNTTLGAATRNEFLANYWAYIKT